MTTQSTALLHTVYVNIGNLPKKKKYISFVCKGLVEYKVFFAWII